MNKKIRQTERQRRSHLYKPNCLRRLQEQHQRRDSKAIATLISDCHSRVTSTAYAFICIDETPQSIKAMLPSHQRGHFCLQRRSAHNPTLN
ncbi:hypothetical protein NC997_04850 [Trichocoleus sp. DQ-A2]